MYVSVRALGHPELELQRVVGCPECSGIEPRFSARAASVISPALELLLRILSQHTEAIFSLKKIFKSYLVNAIKSPVKS